MTITIMDFEHFHVLPDTFLRGEEGAGVIISFAQ